MPALDARTPGTVGRLALYLPATMAEDWVAISAALEAMVDSSRYQLAGQPSQWVRTEQDGSWTLHVECDVAAT